MRLREYETICIFKPFSSQETVDKLIQKIRPLIDLDQGGLVSTQAWGRKRLMYLINKEREGLYIRLHYVANSRQIAEIEKIMSYDDSVLKFLTVKISDASVTLESVKGRKEAEIPAIFRPEPEYHESRHESRMN